MILLHFPNWATWRHINTYQDHVFQLIEILGMLVQVVNKNCDQLVLVGGRTPTAMNSKMLDLSDCDWYTKERDFIDNLSDNIVGNHNSSQNLIWLKTGLTWFNSLTWFKMIP